ncbi:MAG: hypothetical protein VKL39_19150 [Leptolyngbyaceae bacterium]|nr:hypothetical protein [Leptolyngbyaceae bacterium]
MLELAGRTYSSPSPHQITNGITNETTNGCVALQTRRPGYSVFMKAMNR